jgi:hypothetical protein
MQTPDVRDRHNPLAGLISDEDYRQLQALNLLSDRAIRDYQMRTAFRRMRREQVSAAAALQQLRHDYPYLQLDTIRKIVYHSGGGL